MLIKHNLVSYHADEVTDSTASPYYVFNSDQALYRLAFPLFQAWLQKEHSKLHADILGEIFNYGSLSKEQLLDVLGKEKKYGKDAISATIVEMTQHDYIVGITGNVGVASKDTSLTSDTPR